MANIPHTPMASDKLTDNTQNPYFGSLAVLTSLFFIWGFITSLNDILIPHLKAVFTLNYTQAMLIQFCFFTAYFVVSMPSGYLVERIGFKGGIITGLSIAGLGCLLFYPAAGRHSYPLFLAAFFVLASGITLLQVAANPYVTILGKPETASSRLTMTQAFNSLGTTIAPYFGALFILSAAVKTADEIRLLNAGDLSAYQAAQAAVVQHPYLLLAGVLFLIAGLFAAIKLPRVEPAESHVREISDDAFHESAWGYRHLVLGAVGIFVYVGAEVQPGKVLAFNALAASVLVVASMIGAGPLAIWSILAVGLCNSIMFPTLFSLALNSLGEHTGQGSGILCAAIVGGAIIPVVQGLFADRIGIQQAFFIPVLCYLYIAYYGWKGHRLVS
jgi:FHS family L-fucose permease-like MFS transporter